MRDILTNVTVNALSAIICTIPGLLLALISLLINRQRTFQFFGISSKKRTIRIYVSRLEILKGGTEGVEGEKITRGYSGPAINQIEYAGALMIRSMLRSSFLSVLPERIQIFLGNVSSRLITVDPDIDVSPKKLAEIPDDHMVIIGSSIYNAAAKLYLERVPSAFYFEKDSDGNRLLIMRNAGEVKGRPDRELAIIQRISNPKVGNTVIICAGVGSGATYGAVEHLAKHWRELQVEFRDQDFAVCLSFEHKQLEGRDSILIGPPKELHKFTLRRD